MSTAPQDRTDLIRSSRFRAEREASWRQLEALVTRAEKAGVAALGYEAARDLASLYRQAMNALSLARAISMDQALERYLEALCARAYLVVYAPQESIRGVLGRFLTQRVPQTVRRAWPPLLLGFLAMALGVLVGYVLFQQDQSWFFSFVPSGLSDGRAPGASVSYLRDTLFDGGGRDGDTMGVFAAFLFSHNTQIAIFTFALGIFAALPSFVLTFYNGLVLGAFYALFASAGLGYEAFGWLSVHGVTEISAISIACAGGAQLGLAVLQPGHETRRAALRRVGPDAVTLMILAGLMLIVAAGIEGFLRQIVQTTQWRLAIGWGVGGLWLLWVLCGGRAPSGGRG
ncbi:stage II sporulation protein M [Phaeovulum sp. W22_SRMD_FR3]|uniref:stage II sporulation protein M n=1 Tax=Phaeovulum sp. W22_SRMD_FR3 TaxID=3240274 RepID=UPI003F9B3036